MNKEELINTVMEYFEDLGMNPELKTSYDEDAEITSGIIEVGDTRSKLVVYVQYETDKAYYFYSDDAGRCMCDRINPDNVNFGWLFNAYVLLNGHNDSVQASE